MWRSSKRPGTDRDRAGHYALAGAVLVAGPLARELYYARYPLASSEAVGLVAGLAVAGAAVAVLGRYLGRYLGGAIFAGLLLIFIGFLLDSGGAAAIVGIAAACLAFALFFQRWRASIIGVALAGSCVASLPFRGPAEVSVKPVEEIADSVAVGPIVHIVLDEHLGIGGFRGIGDTVTADFLMESYLRRGFDVYPAAYSRWNVTRESFASTLSLGTVVEHVLLTPYRKGAPAPLASNPYFERLASLGYRIHVFQSDDLDFCRTPGLEVATCVQVPPNSVANISYLRIPWTKKARLILEFHFLQSPLLGWVFPHLEGQPRRVFANRAVAVFRRATDAMVRRKNRAEAFFAHVLLPHHPYEVDQECVGHLERRLSPALGPLPDSLRWRREPGYRAQVRCIHRVLGEFIDQVDAAFGPGRAIIIVQGDHGSRATHRCEPTSNCNSPRPPPATETSVKSYRPVDFAAEFSTLLVVRRPGGSGGVHWEATPVQDFLWAFITADFKTVPAARWDHYVYLNELPRRIPHPLRPIDMLWALNPPPSHLP